MQTEPNIQQTTARANKRDNSRYAKAEREAIERRERARASQNRAQEKEINWCYPTSPGAVRAGKSKSGCFSLSIIDHVKFTSKAVSYHDTMTEATAAAEAIALPFSPYSMNIFSEKV